MPFDVLKYAGRFFKLPSPSVKAEWVREYEAISTHVQGDVAERLIKERRPYEDKEILAYRITNYEPITQGPFARFNSDLSRVFSGSQVTIDVDDPALLEYINGANFDGMNLRNYWSRKLCRRMISDPNGVLIRWVDRVPEQANEKVQPTLIMLLSKNIIHFNDDVLSWLANEKSDIEVPGIDGGREVRAEGKVFYIVTTDAYWKLTQVGKQEDGDYELILHYRHALGRLPIDILGGEEVVEADPETNYDRWWFRSFIANAIPFANECARQWSDHQGVLVTAGFPMKEMDPIDCTERGCESGKITSIGPDDKPLKQNCPKCHGRGKIPPFSPYGVLLRKKAGVLQGGAAADDKDMVKFLSPDVAILEFGGKTWRDYKLDLEKELYQLFIEEAQSGKAKDVDREGKVAKLDEIGNHLFMVLMKNTIIDFAALMFTPLTEEDIHIMLPATFVVRSEEDLTGELKTLRESFTPFLITGQVALEFIRKRFPGNPTAQRIFMGLSKYDPLFGMTDSDVIAAKNGGVVDDVMVRRHTLGYAAIQQLVDEKGIEVIYAKDFRAQVDAKVEEILPAARMVPDEPPEEEGPFGGR